MAYIFGYDEFYLKNQCQTNGYSAASTNGHNAASTAQRGGDKWGLSLIGTGVTRRDATHNSAQNSSTTRVTLSKNGRSSSTPIAYQQVAPTQATATASSLARTRDLATAAAATQRRRRRSEDDHIDDDGAQTDEDVEVLNNCKIIIQSLNCLLKLFFSII